MSLYYKSHSLNPKPLLPNP